MNIWLTLTLIAAAIVYGIDYLVRRKKWRDNTKDEKISLLVNMFSIGPHLFFSAAGLLWSIGSGRPENAFAAVMYDVTLAMGSIYFFLAAAAAIASLVLRKMGRSKASTWINVIALAYIVIVLGISGLLGGAFF